MRGNLIRIVQGVILMCLLSVAAIGQKGGGQSGGQSGQQNGQAGQGGGQNSQSGGASGGQGLPGLSYSPAQWPLLVLPDVKGPAPTFSSGRAVGCFRLAKANSGTQPFVLERLADNEFYGTGFYRPCGDDGKGESDSEGRRQCAQDLAKATHHWSPCSTLKDKQPILGGQELVVGIDISDLGDTGVNVDQLKLLNINVTNQQGSPLNPSPIRPSFPSTSSGGGGGGTPGSAGAADTASRHSGWTPVGTHAPEGANPQPWAPDRDYKKGDVVTDSSGRNFFVAAQKFTSGPPPQDPFPLEPQVERIMDGDVLWQEMNGPDIDKGGQFVDAEGLKAAQRAHPWKPVTDYAKGDVVCVARKRNGEGVGTLVLDSAGSCAFAQQQLGAQEKLSQQGAALLEGQPLALAVLQETISNVVAMDPLVVDDRAHDLKERATKLRLEGAAPKPGAPKDPAKGCQKPAPAGGETLPELKTAAALDLDTAACLLEETKNGPDTATRDKWTREASILQAADGVLEAAGILKEGTSSPPRAKAVSLLDQADKDLVKAAVDAGSGEADWERLLAQAVNDLAVDEMHLHYYRAVKGGRSGLRPADPLSIVTIPRAIYLTWPYELPGDVIPTITVNLIYSPPAPGAPWQGDTFYPAGSVVTSSSNNGRFYTALTGGISGAEPREPDLPVDVPPTTGDGDLVWLDSGATAPNVSAASGQSSGGGQGGGGGGAGGAGGGGGGTASKPQLWLANAHYMIGDVIQNPYNGHYYTMVRSNGGTSGKAAGQPSQSAAGAGQPASTDPFPPADVAPVALRDGDLLWVLSTLDISKDPWKKGHYKKGDSFTQGNATFTVASFSPNAATSGTYPFDGAGPGFSDGDLLWTPCPDKGDPKCNDSTNDGVWKSGSPFKDGAVVASGGKRYYVSLVFGGKPQGNSGDPFTKPKLKADQKPPAPAAPTAAAAPDPPVAPPGDGDVLWKDSGTPGAGALWMPSHSYSLGDSVASVGGELFVMVGAATGSTGDSRPVIPNQSGAPTTVTDNDVVWMHADNANCASQTGWQANHNYRLDDYVYGQNKQCYRAVRFTAGMSGPAPVCPFPPATSQGVQPDPNGVLDGNITWKAVPSDGGSSKAWQAGDPHTKGDVVYAGDDRSHFWQAQNSGRSGEVPAQPTFRMMLPRTVVDSAAEVCDGGVTWSDLGSQASIPDYRDWKAGAPHVIGDVVKVVSADKAHYYRALTAGASGSIAPAAMAGDSKQACDSELTWVDSGVIRPLGLVGQPTWKPKADVGRYNVGDVVFVPGPGNGRYYTALTGGTPGNASPFASLAPELPVTWQDSGTTAPSAVASGQPADQNIGLVNLALPQTHSLSYFNLSAGVIAGLHRYPTFGFVGASQFTKQLAGYAISPTSAAAAAKLAIDPNTGCTVDQPGAASPNAYYCPANTGLAAQTVDPVLVLTVYPIPVDAELPWRPARSYPWKWLKNGAWRDLIPGIGFGMSLANPTTNFYVGGSVEAFVRNVQVFGGLAVQKVAYSLGSNLSQPVWGGTGTAPAVSMISGFRTGPFVGVTYNLSGFVQSLFGGGGAKGQ